MLSALHEKPIPKLFPELGKLADATKKKKFNYQNTLAKIKEHQDKCNKAIKELKDRTHNLTTTITTNVKSKELGFEGLFYQIDKINYSL